ncbi:TonB-dependent receptor [Flavobacterium nitrogenifigens]|uniref:Outer membrane receptor proteins, mostly Fe transport n=1 Tax=Flavobacterium nitrogenifigens TaxID=1617283 RepID=A0A521F4P0_9FLAO|nr:TonB-dependent receptor [Flavobacterium nitrogenifigens]KAF2336702.1 TonB-dependent receptor [Flavobacterium nitrogenifigens]SMO91142.1 Outer membrane receptor proteins, mostly Fe transport [Flavobacterium nitrogenifigens]
MNRIILVSILFLFQINIFGQQFSIKGKIINQNKTPLEFATATLLKTDKTLYQQASTDSLGNFTLNPEKGNYKLIIEQFGTEFCAKEIIVHQDLDLGIIEVKEFLQLDGVTINSRKKLVEQKVDRLVFNVENSVVATGGTALDALKSTPTVRVQNETISIVGKGEVLVMIDDRLNKMTQEDLVAFLRSIPADNIKSIEVITTPPAKYEAEGNSGLINIKLKTAKANSWNANLGTTYVQRSYASGNINGLFIYNYNKLSLQASINKGIDQFRTTSDARIYYPNELWKQDIATKSKTNLLSIGFGADYKLTEKWTSGIKYLGSFNDRTSANNPLTTRYNTSGEINSYILSHVNAQNSPQMNSINWNNVFTLNNEGKNITVDLDYFNYQKDDSRVFSGNEMDNEKENIPETNFAAINSNLNQLKNYSAKIDVSIPYSWANISFGGKGFYTNTKNNLTVFDNETGTPILNTESSNIFNYKEYNEAIYFSANKKLNEKWETQIGLRAEATQTEGYSENLNQTNKNNYIKLFPTAYLTYNANDNNTYSLNYSRRIRRPDFDYLNPFVIRTSPFYYSEGNPFLKPSIIDNFEFSYIRNQKWVNTIYFSQVSNFGQQLAIIDPETNITKSTPINYADTYQIGLSTYYNFNKYAWWNSFMGFNLNYQNVKSRTNLIASVDGYNGYIYSNNDFTVNQSKTLFLGLNYGLQLPGRYQVFNISTLNILDISVKFLALKKNLSITLTGEDLLNAQKPLISYYSNGIKNTMKNYNDSRAFRIALSYKFGNQNVKSKERNFGNEEERNRAN